MASVDHELTIKLFVQPQIVGIGEGFGYDKLFIVCELHVLLCTIPHQSIVDSIVALLSSVYIVLTWYIKTAKPYCLS